MKKQVFHDASQNIQETRVAKGYIIGHFLSEDERVIFSLFGNFVKFFSIHD